MEAMRRMYGGLGRGGAAEISPTVGYRRLAAAAHRKYRRKSLRRCHANRQKSVKLIWSASKPQYVSMRQRR